MSELTLVYFGHHKCASRYITAIFRQTASLLGLQPCRTDHLSAELPLGYHLRAPYAALLHKRRGRLLTDPAMVMCLSNGDSEAVDLLEQRGAYRGFHIIRDPRDILVSAYFSHRYSHAIPGDGGWMAEFRHALNTAPDIERGLLLEMKFSAANFRRMATWNFGNPTIYEGRYETLIVDPVLEFSRIFNFLGIKTPWPGLQPMIRMAVTYLGWRLFKRPMPMGTTLPMPVLRYLVDRNSFQHRSQGRRPGQENQTHHYRKGIAGDWRNYFTPRITDTFKECYGDLLIQLGYESSSDWL